MDCEHRAHWDVTTIDTPADTRELMCQRCGKGKRVRREAMPMRPPHPCSKPGCPTLTDQRFCVQHGRQAEQERGSARSKDGRGYGWRWMKVRTMKLRREPMCEECRTEAASEVHHIVAKRDGGDDGFENLQSLCKPCHSRKTMQEQHGNG